MKRIAAMFAVVFLTSASSAQAQDHFTTAPAGCAHVYSQPYYRALSRVAIKRAGTLDQHRVNHLAYMRRCAVTPAAHRGMLRYTRRLFARRREWQAYLAVTPFLGPNGTRWAIPWVMVSCESHGHWGAHNPSGASGPYQLLGHGEIYPARTFAERLQNHRIARSLYLHSGTGPWNPSRSCWG